MTFGLVLTWVERKQGAIMSDRIGANRAYLRIPFTQVKLVWWGLFHGLADGMKMLLKEDWKPHSYDKLAYAIAPGRGRGRGRDAEPVAAAGRPRGRTRSEAAEPVAASGRTDGQGLVALPGERLSRAAGPLTEADLARAEVFRLDDLDDEATDALDESTREPGALVEGEDGEPRRRRRRGGRGRGRGRSRAEDGGAEDEVGGEQAEQAESAERAERPERAAPAARAARPPAEDDDEDVAPARRGPATTPFGSVWDSQLGTPSASTAPRAPITDDEDFDEPEIPEYLIAEQRRGANRGGGGGGNRGARGGRSAYQSAMERERYGRGGGGGGINRYPDVSARPRSSTPPREERSYGRGDRPADRPAPSGPRNSSEPWSDVPPELEAMLRAQVAQKPVTSRPVPATAIDEATADAVEATDAVESAAAAPKTRAARKPAASKATDAPKTRAPRKSAATATAADPVEAAARELAPADSDAAAPKAAKPRAARKPAAAKATAEPEVSAEGEAATDAAPKRRTTRKAAPAENA